MRQNGTPAGNGGTATKAVAPDDAAAAPAADPAPVRTGKRADLILSLASSLALLLAVGIEAVLVLPTLSAEMRSLSSERRDRQAREEEQRRWDKILEESRKDVINRQAQIVTQQETVRRLTIENLRLATELANKLAKEK